ncbi:GH3 auxin-responsive promoter family protein [Winogradskyella aurantiaca]|uniref:GH3 auxin-responsive promoter family protein n=1 Tax=Winogradskyella aurantiaca TaxID=2219558 RepID=UPI000E1D7495|nr:GH3 auxin-responsive promoter family protein [Winogradskyella aurantiaca]
MPSIKALLAKPVAKLVKRSIDRWASNPIGTQNKVFKELINSAKTTSFGKDHDFSEISTHEDFVARVPVRDYEALRSYVDRMVDGEPDVLWPGRPLYYAKTSGTTSGSKYIPITKESMPTHISAARNAILMYIAETGNSQFVDGKMIFLQGSPVMGKTNDVNTGRLSGIVAHYVPKYLQRNRLPSYETNCIEDWDTKVDAVVEETINENMTIISGIPPWVLGYFEKLKQLSGKSIGDLFKNFNLFIYGGVNYQPYKAKFDELIGRSVDSIELYPASEGFFAFQDKQNDRGMLLLLDSGIFYEFIKVDAFFNENPSRITLSEVEVGVNYVMIISTSAGLWAYNVGDTIAFTSTSPYKVIVTGRIKHFISAFGEHVIGKEVEKAMEEAINLHGGVVNEFTVAPQVNPETGLPYHEWFVEFDKLPVDLSRFNETLDKSLQEQNSYYKDLIVGQILKPLVITKVRVNGFEQYMDSRGKLGGQNKTPRLANDRKIVDEMIGQNLVF